MPFTDKQIAALRPKAARYEKPEPGRTGLWIRVTPKAEKSWTFRYRYGGKLKRMVFGHYPKMGVALAHKALADARDALDKNIDPGAVVAEQRKAERDAETVRELVTEYLERHARPTMKASTATEDERMLGRDVLPEWGDRKAKDVTRRDVIQLLDKIEDRGARTIRNRTASLLSRLFRFAEDRGIVPASPASGIRRLEEQSRARFLTLDEIRSFWNGLDKADAIPAVRIALRFLLVTGQRRGEAALALRSEIDSAENTWHLPAQRAKNGRENLIPLPPLAMRLIAEADAARVRPEPIRAKPNRPADAKEPSPWLFPSTRFGKAIEPAALTRALNRNREVLGIGDATIHDLRRTFATWHAELGTSADILAALLNHSPTSITKAVYDRASLLEPRRRAMVVWCSWLERVIAGEAIAENVIHLSHGKR
jgi:integrase